MAASVRAKRNQRCYLLSYGSSGNEHFSDDTNSPRDLSEMIIDFIEDSSGSYFSPDDSPDGEVLNDVSTSATDFTEAIGEMRRIMTVNENAEAYRKLLLIHVAAEAVVIAVETNDVVSRRRKFMTFLRDVQHNAAICKTKWRGSGGLTGGNYEFIDVVTEKIRYFIDPDFAAQFEIARPTVQYSELLESLPRVFVGTGEELKRIVRIMCDAAKKSINCSELSVPPWRKNNYMQKKWFGPYRRTINPSSNNTSVTENSSVFGAKCRSVGFDAEVNDRVFVGIK